MSKAISLLFVLAFLAASIARAQAAAPNPYATPPPPKLYLMAPAKEIALARTAAPPSISMHADVLVLGRHGYTRVIKGTNGFVCFIERSWTADFEFNEFWNTRIVAPNCFNPPAVQSELKQYLKRAQWIMAGENLKQVMARTRAAYADRTFTVPKPGAFSFMLSKKSNLGDVSGGGPWLPHVMFFVPHGQTAAWAAGVDGSPVLGGGGSDIESAVLYIPVRRWSDGSAVPAPAAPHVHG